MCSETEPGAPAVGPDTDQAQDTHEDDGEARREEEVLELECGNI